MKAYINIRTLKTFIYDIDLYASAFQQFQQFAKAAAGNREVIGKVFGTADDPWRQGG
jgi:hypothetical protein